MKLSTPLVLKPSRSQPLTISRRFLLGLSQLGKQLIQSIAGNHEVQVWQMSDRAGTSYWRVYDPSTRTSTSFSSANEVRIWLEQRYYQ